MSQEEKSFEESIAELESIVRQLESGTLTLEQSVELYEQGMRISMVCEKTLRNVEQKIEVVISAEHDLQTQPFVHAEDKEESK